VGEMDLRLRKAFRLLRLKPGDLYEDCAYHPVLCLGVNYKSDEIWGVSLVDGSYPRACSLLHCGVRKLTAGEAWRIKVKGPRDPKTRDRIGPDRRWWLRTATSAHADYRAGLVSPRAFRRPVTRQRATGTSRSAGGDSN
jgi:hypothetical protein